MKDTHMPNDFGKYAIAITFLLPTFYWAIQLTAGEYYYYYSFLTASILACIFIGLFTKDLTFTTSWIPVTLCGPLCMKYNAHIANGSHYSLVQIDEMIMVFWIVTALVLIKTLLSERRGLAPIYNKVKEKIGTTNLIFISFPLMLAFVALAILSGILLMPAVFLLPLLTTTRSLKALPMLLATSALFLAIAFNNPQLMMWMLASIAITMVMPPIYSTMKHKLN